MKNQNLAFEQGEKVLVDGEEHSIHVAKKNFSSGQISYVLDHVNGRVVAEKDIKKIKKGKKEGKKGGDTKLDKLRKEYEELLGKKVPSNKKNDEPWITQKIKEAKDSGAELENAKAKYKELYEDEVPTENAEDLDWIKEEIRKIENPTDAEKYAALASLELEELEQVIEEKELDVDPDDYEDEEELLKAICEELEIEIPNEEGDGE
jgi:hypothetical protein